MSGEAVHVEEPSARYLAKVDSRTAPSGCKPTTVGTIAEGWELVPLHQLSGFITKGSTPTTYGFKWEDIGILFLRSECISSDGLDLDQSMFISSAANAILRRSEVHDGDLLITITGNVGRVVLLRGVGTANINQHIARIRISAPNADASYVYHFLSQQRVRRRFESITTGQAYPQISLQQVREAEVALPPLTEQHAIAEALSDVDALLGALDALIAKKRAIKHAAMQQLLTGMTRLPAFKATERINVAGVGILPADWTVVPLEEVCVKIQDGTHFSPKLGGSDRLYITSRNIRFGALDVSNVDTISEEEHRKIYSRCDTRFGDLLLTKDGANTGNAALNTLTDECSLLSSVAFMRFDSRRDDTRFFLQYILSVAGQRRLKEMMSGNAITRLTLAKINGFRVPRATCHEQQAIATVLSDMDAEIAALKTRRDKTRAIKRGMMQQLLTGRMRLVKPQRTADAC